jgi:negative regulator of flagellin synthesis FlgM
MRVNQSGNNPQASEIASRVKVTHAKPQKGEKASEASAQTHAAASGDANTEISAKAKEFAKAKAVAHDAPDVREEKIAALKARIADGKYKIDADAIADRMVDDHIKMHGVG